jgi:hypothetical protein
MRLRATTRDAEKPVPCCSNPKSRARVKAFFARSGGVETRSAALNAFALLELTPRAAPLGYPHPRTSPMCRGEPSRRGREHPSSSAGCSRGIASCRCSWVLACRGCHKKALLDRSKRALLGCLRERTRLGLGIIAQQVVNEICTDGNAITKPRLAGRLGFS